MRVMSGRGSTSFARSRAIAFANGPQREPSMRDFVYYDGPGFDGGGAVKCGFQDERAARFGEGDAERETGGRAGGIHDEREPVFRRAAFEIGGVTADEAWF